MADPTPDEVRAALAILAAAETARESHVGGAAPGEPVKSSTQEVDTPQAEQESVAVESVEPAQAESPAAAAEIKAASVSALDSYLSRSVKSSPNGF